MFQHHSYAIFFDRSFSFFAEIDVIIIDVVKMMFVEDCDAVKIDVVVNEAVISAETILLIEATSIVESDVVEKIDVSIIVKIVEIIENDCKKTSTDLKAIVKNFLSRQIDDLLINVTLFFLINSHCSNFFIKFKQLFKYNINFHSLNFDLYSNYLTKYCVTIIRSNLRKRLILTFFIS